MLRALCRAQSRPYTGTLTPLKTARYSTVDTAFPRMRRPLAYKSTPRALRMRESHRLNGTLTRLILQRTARKILSCAGIKVGFTKKRKFRVVGLPLFLFLRNARLF